MNPVIPCSIGNVSIFPGFTYSTRKNNSLTRLSLSRSNVKPESSTRRFLLPSFVASGVFSQNKRICSFHKKSRTSISATETDVAVEEPGPPVADEDSGEIPSNEVSSPKSDANPEPANTKRSRPARKSEMPPVKNEDLIPGATFTGKVKSVQPFGAFVDFGAFTDGLVHISMLSDNYVKDVASVVSVGQEVKVKLIEVNTETQRISLSMRENAETGGKPRKDAAITTEKPGPRKRNTSKSGPKKDNVTKSSKFVVGQELVGSVKNMIRNGAFISLPEGEEGFLPVSEEPDEGFENVMGNTSLEVGQEVNVRVLRINRGQVTLTMKKEEDAGDLDSTFNHGVVHAATNPFVLAFRKNKDIASFLDGREKTQTEVPKPSTTGTPEEIKGTVKQGETVLDVPDMQDEPESSAINGSSTAVVDDESNLVNDVSSPTPGVDSALEKETVLDVPDVQDEPESSEKLTDDVPSALEQNAEQEISENEVDVGASAINGSSTAVVDDESSPTPGVDSALEKETVLDVPDVQDEPESSEKLTDDVPSALEQNAEKEISENEVDVGASAINGSSTAVVDGESSPTPGVDSALEKETVLDVPDVQDEPESSEKLTDDVPSALEQNAEQEISENEVDVGASAINGSSTAVVDDESSPTPGVDSALEKEIVLDLPDVQDEPESSEKLTDGVPSALEQNAEQEISENEVDVGTSAINGSSTAVVGDESNLVSDVSSPTPGVDSAIEKETEVASGSLIPEEDLSTVNPIIEEATQTDVTTSDLKTDSPAEIANENVIGSGVDQVAEDEKQLQTPNTSEEFAAAALTDSDVVEPSPDTNDTITESDITSNAPAPQEAADDDVGGIPESNDSLSGQSGVLSPVGSLSTDATEETDQVPSPEGSAIDEVKTSIDDPEEEVQTQSPATENEISITSQVEDNEVAIASEKNSSSSNSDGQAGTTSGEGLTKATISPALVKQLREETGAGMMDCKKALAETDGDIVKAQEYLRKKGLSSAEKKASRVTAEGRIGSYIHDSRIGVLVEVNCETDFVSRGEIFKELVDDIAMQVAACPQVEYLVTEDVPEEIVNKEKEIELQKEDLASKPEQIRSKIVEGRIRKRLEELALLEQPYIKNDKLAVKDLVKQTIATIGENIKVKRFVRFNLGEGLEKKSQDFAAEVAAQTAAKPAPTPAKEQPAVAEAKETEPKKSTVAVSASLVKQLREETGAGMMDCKKALAETGGDLEKAQDYLRKKGLSSADKKSSRLAAEGRIGAYIHDSRIGVLIEVNCETDFVGRGEKFKELVDDLAMQVVACPQVQFVSIEDIPEAVVKKEKELEMQREDLLSKPENIREKIVEGRVSKRLGELVLLEQPFIKDDSVLVKDLVKQTVAALGENIKVRRFVRFTLGETAEKETMVPA